MLSLGLLALAALNADPSNLVQVDRTAPSDEAPIRLWLNNGSQFREGERARVQIETRDDGYLLVFNYDTDGRLRVIFPVDPSDDNFVRGGRRYEVRGRGDRESFIVGRDGDGIVYAAVSPDPFRLDEIEAGGNWDYSRVSIGSSSDPEADVTDLMLRLASDRGFDYDVISYRVYGYEQRYVGTGWYPRPYSYWNDYYCDPWYRPSLFGCSYYPVGGWHLGYSYPYRYGWGWGGYRYPWYGNRYVYTVGRRNYPVVVGRPRGYTIVRRGDNTGTTRVGSSIGGARGTRSVIDYRPRGRARPESPAVTRPSSEGRPSNPSASRPRARRSPPSAESSRPTIERDRGNRARRPVDVDSDRGAAEPRRSEPSTPRSDDRPRASRPRGSGSEPRMERRVEPRAESVRPEPRRTEPRAESRPSVPSEPRRVEPRRSEPRPAARSEPRRSEPRSAPAPRAEPRREAPRSEPSRPRRPRG